MSLIVTLFTCALRGHRWDVAPTARRAASLECVRCGLRTDTVRGLET